MLDDNLKPPLILFCKDIGKIAFIKRALKNIYLILQTSSTQEAIEWLKASPIDVIIVDHFADDICLDIVKQLSEVKKLPRPAILLITNKLLKNFTVEAYSAGVCDFLREPLSDEEILMTITRSLKERCVSKKIPFVTGQIKKGAKRAKDARLLQHRSILTEKSLDRLIKATLDDLPVGILLIEIDVAMAKEANELEYLQKSMQGHIQTLLRPQDLLIPEGVGRYLVLLPKTSERAARIMAEDIKKALPLKHVYLAGKEILITAEIAACSYTKEMKGQDSSFGALESILEKVKKSLEKD